MTLTFLPRTQQSRAFDSNCALVEGAAGKAYAVIQHVAPSKLNLTRPASSIVQQPLSDDLFSFCGPRQPVVQCDDRASLLYHYEEPRVVHRPSGGFYMLVCAWGEQYFQDNVNFHTVGHQILYELNEQLKVQKESHPVYRYNGAHHFSNLKHEKNWLPFLYEDQLFMVYHETPHTVFHEIDEYETTEYITSGVQDWKYGTPSGGTPPQPFDDKTSLVFFHSYLMNGSIRIYHIGAYLMENSPPFRVVRNSKTPLAIGDPQHTADKTFKAQTTYLLGSSTPSSRKQRHGTLFPCGAVKRGDYWLVGTGINNVAAGILTFSSAEIEASL